MMPDKDLTDDVLDEIIAGAKTSMEQYLALSLKAEREAFCQTQPTDDERIMAIEGIAPACDGHIRYESNAGGNLWIQCSKKKYERMRAAGMLTRVLYERPQNQQQNIPENIPTLREAVIAMRNSGIDIDIEKIIAERDFQNSTVIPGGWTPVSERMPEDRESVLLWDIDLDDACSGHYSHQTGNFYQAGMIIENEITHWMPLPAAPQQE